jgi:hypothetical protein
MSKNPVILNVIHHRQNHLETNSDLFRRNKMELSGWVVCYLTTLLQSQVYIVSNDKMVDECFGRNRSGLSHHLVEELRRTTKILR